MVVIDPDVRSIPTSRIARWIRKLQPDQAVTALGLRWYSPLRMEFHDAYAYRDKGDYSAQTMAGIMWRRKSLSFRLRRGELLPVRSNFNGLGIYPLEALRGCNYQALENDDPQVQSDCEHVAVHDQLASRGVEVIIDPKLKVVYNGWLAVTTGIPRARIKRWLTTIFCSKIS